MSEFGPLRHFAATQQFGRFRSEADIQSANSNAPAHMVTAQLSSVPFQNDANSVSLFRPHSGGCHRSNRATRDLIVTRLTTLAHRMLTPSARSIELSRTVAQSLTA